MKQEFSKDKYLALLLVAILLAAYVFTRDAVLQTLLVTAVGGFLGLVRSSSTSSTTTISSENAPAVSGDVKSN